MAAAVGDSLAMGAEPAPGSDQAKKVAPAATVAKAMLTPQLYHLVSATTATGVRRGRLKSPTCA